MRYKYTIDELAALVVKDLRAQGLVSPEATPYVVMITGPGPQEICAEVEVDADKGAAWFKEQGLSVRTAQFKVEK